MKWLMHISEQWRGLLALGSAFMVGALAVIALMGFIALPERVDHLESQWETHTDSVTAPNVARIDRLERQIQALPEIRAMVYEMWCDRFPDRCRAFPNSTQE